jgi:hypothetical protein
VNQSMFRPGRFGRKSLAGTLPFAMAVLAPAFALAQNTTFTPGNLVVAVEGCGVYGGTCTVPNGTGTGAGNSSVGGYGDNQAAPLTLFQFSPVGTGSVAYVNSLVLPQTAVGGNLPVSGEYGSSSEATLQLSGNGQYLAVLGYGINAATFNASPAAYGASPSNALAQSGSLTGQSYTPVSRVLALIDANGNVSSTTALFNVFNLNNPRSVYTANGTSAYVSGQGASGDATGGVFYTTVGATNTAPVAITGLDTTNNTVAQDTREVQIYNNTLYVSADTKGGSNAARDYIGTLGTPGNPPTTLVGPPVQLNNFGTSSSGKYTITTGPDSNGNAFNAGLQINLSPNNYFFANPATLYVADGGNPKNNSANSSLGDGGLQKWINSKADGSGTWTLAYTLYNGLGLVKNSNTTGSTGLYGLAGTVVNGNVLLYATDYTLNDLDGTHLFGITDNLSYTTASQAASEIFTTLASAPSDSNFKGVAFAPAKQAESVVLTSAFTLQQDNSYLLKLTVTNNGAGTLEDVDITGVTVGNASATGLPKVIGPIAAGNSASVTVAVPASAGAPGATVLEKVVGVYDGGSLSGSYRAKLP